MKNNLTINNEKYTYNDGSWLMDGDIIQIDTNYFDKDSVYKKFGLIYFKDNTYFMWQFYQIRNGNFECSNLPFNEFLQNVESNKISFSKLANIYDYDVLQKDRKLIELDYFSLLTKLREIMHIIMPLRKLADSASQASDSIQSLTNALKDINSSNYCFVGALDENHNHYRYTKKYIQ